MHMEPMAVGRSLSVLNQVMKGPEATAAVVEHPIQDQTHPAAMHLRQEGIKRRITTEQGIHLQIVVGVITMVGR